MNVHLAAQDLARLETASRIMLSPFGAPDVDAWRRACMHALCDILEAEKATFSLPGATPYFLADGLDPDHVQLINELAASVYAGNGPSRDPFVDACHRVFLARGAAAWDIAAVEHVLGGAARRSIYYNEILVPMQGTDAQSLFVPTPAGSASLTCYTLRRDVEPGENLPLLRALLPSLQAGLDMLLRFQAQRQALDSFSDPVVVFGSDHRELHRNAALIRLCDVDPERERILMEVTRMAFVLHALCFPRPGCQGEAAFVPGVRSVTTQKAHYDLKGTLLPPGVFEADASIMIMITKRGRAELPASVVLRERYSLTVREAEVALLLAEGRSNGEIADRLFVSPHTARRHTANLFDKLAVSSRKALALKFLRE